MGRGIRAGLNFRILQSLSLTSTSDPELKALINRHSSKQCKSRSDAAGQTSKAH